MEMNLLYFFIGVIFIELVIPILESLATLVVTVLEALSTKIAVSVAKSKISIQKICEDAEPKETANAIGFVYHAPEEKDDYYEEEENSKK